MPEIIELTGANFESVIEQDGAVFVDAWAPWCGPCRMFAPVFEAAAAEHPRHTFAKLDTEANKNLVKDLRIAHIPTLLIYREGILLYHEAGSPDAATLADIIVQVEGLDMDVVRTDLAKRAGADSGHT